MQPNSGKRKDPRIRRRLQVVFDHDPDRPAHTNSISRKGIGVSSDFIAVPGSKIEAAVVLPGDQKANFEAVVVWARKVRAGDSLTAMNTMGLEFTIPPGELYARLFVPGQSARPAKAGLPVPDEASAKPRQIPARTSQQAPGPQAGRHAVGSWPVSPLGHQAQLTVTVDAKDFSAHPERYPGSISLLKAAGWIEQAAVRSLAALLPAGMVTIGLGMQVNVKQHPPVLVGDKLDITAEVAEVGEDGQLLRIEARITSGKREIGKGHMTRMLVGQQTLS